MSPVRKRAAQRKHARAWMYLRRAYAAQREVMEWLDAARKALTEDRPGTALGHARHAQRSIAATGRSTAALDVELDAADRKRRGIV